MHALSTGFFCSYSKDFDEAVMEFITCHVLGASSTESAYVDANQFLELRGLVDESDFQAFVGTLLEAKLSGSFRPIFRFLEEAGGTLFELRGSPDSAESVTEARPVLWRRMLSCDVWRFASVINLYKQAADEHPDQASANTAP